MDIKYRLVFRGFKEGISANEARDNVGKLFNLPIESVQAIFSARGRAVKSGVTLDHVVRLQKAIDSAGVVCTVEPDKSNGPLPDRLSQQQEARSNGASQGIAPSAEALSKVILADVGASSEKDTVPTSDAEEAVASEKPTPDEQHTFDRHRKSADESANRKQDPSSRSGNMKASLIECASCGKGISPNAKMCPGCGAPNNWVHPRIKAFIEGAQNIATTAQFRYLHQGAELNGWTDPTSKAMFLFKASAIVWAIVAIFWTFSIPRIFGMLFGFGNVTAFFGLIEMLVVWFGPMIGILAIIAGVIRSVTGGGEFTQKRFKADFSVDPPAWECNDEKFWQPVRSVLKISAETAMQGKD